MKMGADEGRYSLPKRMPTASDLVAGAGFEPAVPQSRDYERDNPVRV